MRAIILLALGAFSVSSCNRVVQQSGYPIASLDSVINDHLQPLLDTAFADSNKGMMALAVYLMDETNVLVDTTYYLSNKENVLPNDSTLFQLGSVTKVFTAAMVAQQVTKGAMDLQAPAINYLPPGNPTLPNKYNNNTVTITLGQLTAMSSGLPRDVPKPRKLDSMTYPYAFAALDNMNLLFAPGSDCYLYSNLGFGIAGLVLSHQAHPNAPDYYNQYETVLIDSLLNPMGLSNTRITLDANQENNRALPYGKNKKYSTYWNPEWPMNYAAGGLYSSLPDMQVFAKNMIGEGSTLSQQDLDTLLASRGLIWRDTCKINNGSYGSHQAMGWVLHKDFQAKNQQINRWAKDGGLAGTSTYITFSTPTLGGKKYKGYVVMLVNRSKFPVQNHTTNTLDQLFNLIP